MFYAHKLLPNSLVGTIFRADMCFQVVKSKIFGLLQLEMNFTPSFPEPFTHAPVCLASFQNRQYLSKNQLTTLPSIPRFSTFLAVFVFSLSLIHI